MKRTLKDKLKSLLMTKLESYTFYMDTLENSYAIAIQNAQILLKAHEITDDPEALRAKAMAVTRQKIDFLKLRLEKLETEDSVACISCGRPIEEKKLFFQPETTNCLVCEPSDEEE